MIRSYDRLQKDTIMSFGSMPARRVFERAQQDFFPYLVSVPEIHHFIITSGRCAGLGSADVGHPEVTWSKRKERWKGSSFGYRQRCLAGGCSGDRLFLAVDSWTSSLRKQGQELLMLDILPKYLPANKLPRRENVQRTDSARNNSAVPRSLTMFTTSLHPGGVRRTRKGRFCGASHLHCSQPAASASAEHRGESSSHHLQSF